MRILFITPYVPSRIRVRPFQFIRELAKRHNVHVIALGDAEAARTGGPAELTRVVEDLQIVPHSRYRGLLQALAALPNRTPMCAAYCRSRLMSRAVSDAVLGAGFDVAHVEHIRAAHFAPSGLPVVFDAVDCLTGLFRQMARARKNPLAKMVMAEEAWKLRGYEPSVIRHFSRTVITSESERDELLALDPMLRADVVPNGVDATHFAPTGLQKHPHRVVFSGKMSYFPNAQAALWFAVQVFPDIRRRWPDAEFVIVGSDPSPEVARLPETSPGVTVTGYVDDTRPCLESAAVAVAPMQVAVGIQNKVLEAMAMGLPVVVSPPAARPFGGDCPGILKAGTPAEMLSQVTRLFENQQAAVAIGIEGRAEVVRRFSWEAATTALEHIYAEAIGHSERNAA